MNESRIVPVCKDKEEKGDAGFYAEEERGASPSLSRMREEMIASRRESGNAIKRMRMSDEEKMLEVAHPQSMVMSWMHTRKVSVSQLTEKTCG